MMRMIGGEKKRGGAERELITWLPAYINTYIHTSYTTTTATACYIHTYLYSLSFILLPLFFREDKGKKKKQIGEKFQAQLVMFHSRNSLTLCCTVYM